MVICPPFRWASKGKLIVNSGQDTNIVGVRRATIKQLPEDANLSGNNLNGTVVIPEVEPDLTVDSSNTSKNPSAVRLSNTIDPGRVSKESDDEDSRRNARRKLGVIAPSAPEDKRADLHYTKYEKDAQSQEQIKKAIMNNDFLKNLMDDIRLNGVVEAMSPVEYSTSSLIIREGESGSHLFVSAFGQFEVIKGGQVVATFGPGKVFGELAILYKAKRFATIRSATEAKVWSLERRVFQKIMVLSGRQEQDDNLRFLSSVPLLRGIHEIELKKIADFLKREFFAGGTAIVRQGERGDKFYIIRGGTVIVNKRDGDEPERQVGALRRGDFFGEQALLHDDRRLATVVALGSGVECLTLERGPFTELIGNLEELKKIRHPVPRKSEIKKKIPKISTEYDYVELKDLGIVGTMGLGGFGRVELAQYTKDKSLTFALKCLKKIDMVQQQQQEHAFNEKNIMLACNSSFICRLYRTFKNDKYIYFLMEPILGGDVWTILQKQRFFPEATARFMSACVVEAFQYLHARDIIYRDLKPENLMLDERGYIKVVDFGFAKQLSPNSKTWTFAGTPEYVAPEIVLAKGHDRAVDCWALGVFIHELLVGKPPFRAPGGDHMKTYALILRGIEQITFHPRVTKSAQTLIKKLCKAVPAERLGYLKNGMEDVKNHKWFQGFDWVALRDRKMKAPLIPRVKNNTDLSNFENYSREKTQPPDETSGWDIDF